MSRCANAPACNTTTERPNHLALEAIDNSAERRVPQVQREDEPDPWPSNDVAVMLGPALDEYEREQATWNDIVARCRGESRLALAVIRSDYLLRIPSAKPSGLVHPNLATALWTWTSVSSGDHLIGIASRLLG